MTTIVALSNCAIQAKANPTHNNPFHLLGLPSELLIRIVTCSTADEQSPLHAARIVVTFGNISSVTHHLFHNSVFMPKVVQLGRLESKFIADRSAINNEILILQGADGFSGSIIKTKKKHEALQEELQMLCFKCSEIMNNLNCETQTNPEQRDLITKTAEIKIKKMQKAERALTKQRQAHMLLFRRLTEQVQYDSKGNVIGGKLAVALGMLQSVRNDWLQMKEN